MFSVILSVLFGCAQVSSSTASGVSLDFDAVPYHIPPEVEVYSGVVKYYLRPSARGLVYKAGRAADFWNETALGYVRFEETTELGEAQLIFECARGPAALNYAVDFHGNFVGTRPFEFVSRTEFVYDFDDLVPPVEVEIIPDYCDSILQAQNIATYVMGHVIGIPDVDDTGTTLGGALMRRGFNDYAELPGTSEWEAVGLKLYFNSLIEGTQVDDSNEETRRMLAWRREAGI